MENERKICNCKKFYGQVVGHCVKCGGQAVVHSLLEKNNLKLNRVFKLMLIMDVVVLLIIISYIIITFLNLDRTVSIKKVPTPYPDCGTTHASCTISMFPRYYLTSSSTAPYGIYREHKLTE